MSMKYQVSELGHPRKDDPSFYTERCAIEHAKYVSVVHNTMTFCVYEWTKQGNYKARFVVKNGSVLIPGREERNEKEEKKQNNYSRLYGNNYR